MNLRVRAQLAALFLSFVAGVPAAQAVNCTSISLSEDTSRAKHFSPAAQSYAFGVTVAPSNCTWSVSKTGSVAGFFTLVTTSPQTGNATINFNLTANAADYRSGSIRVGVDPVFQDFNFFQESPNCSYSISPGSASIPANTQFANYTAIVTSSSNGCLWLATTTDSWLETRPGPYQGSGGQFDWDAYPDNTGPARTGTIRAGDFTHFATLTVMQASGCTFSINPTSNAVGAAGTSSPASVAVTAGAGCTWSATSNAPWITMGTGAGSGNGNATYSVAANTGVARTGTLTIAGQTHTVNQAAVVACTFTINPTSNAVAAGGTTTALSVAVTASAPACAWGASSNDSWITVGTGGGNGSGSATYTVGANSGAARSGTLTVAGQTHTVNQAAAVVACTFTISPASNDFPADGTNVPATVAVTASAPGCAWSATSNASWIFVGTGSGNGSGNATYSVTQNLGTAGRTGSLTIAGKTHTVTQAAAPVTACTYTINPTSSTFDSASGGVGTVAITASAASCAWTAVANDNWITGVTPPSGTGSGSVQFNVASSAGVTRTGTLTIAGQTHTVNEAPAAKTTNPDKTAGDPSKQPGSCACGDPINLGTGSVFEQVTDYSTVGMNPLTFMRSYNSLGSKQTKAVTLGLLWRSNYDRQINIQSATAVTMERPDGRQIDFKLIGGKWTPDADVDATLTQGGSNWTFTDSTDTVETYSGAAASPVLTTIKARNGYTQTLTVNAQNQVTAVTDSYGRKLTFTYSGGLLQTFTTPDGLVHTYSYQAVTGGNLLNKVAYSTTPVTSQTYLYGNAALPLALTGIVDENGNTSATWTHDAQGRALTNSQPGGVGSMTVTYNDVDGSRTVTNALGQQEVYRFTTLQGSPKLTRVERVANGSIAAATRLFTYDGNGYTASDTDWKGNLTTYVNGARGQPTAITRASGTALARTTTVAYDATFTNLPKSVVAPGITTTFTYDAGGNLLTRTATDTTTTTLPYATTGTSRTTTLTWGANFLPASVRGPRTDVTALTTFTYDASGALTATTNALNQVTRITQHLPGGLPQTSVDANGVTRQFVYDARQRLLSTTLTTALGLLTTTFTYDAAGNVLSVKSPDGATITSNYDTANRLAAATDLFNQKIAYTLNALGSATQTRVTNAAATVVRSSTASFDALGRRVHRVGGAGQDTALAYDANDNPVTLTDPLARATASLYDVLDHPVQVTDPAGGNTVAAYDAHDRVTSIADPNSQTTTYVYDGFGRMIAATSPVAGTTVYRYDAAGNLTQKVDGRGVIANHAYDALNRRIATAYPGNTAENVTYAFDESGHGFGIGRLTSLSDSAGTMNRTYDERGNSVSETRTSSGVARSTAYAYDAAGRIAAITYPSGWIVSYVRDAMGRATAVNARRPGAGADVAVVSAIAYLPFGPVSSLTYGNGLTETRSFDLDYRLTGVAVSDSGPRMNLAYGYDAANSVRTVTDAVKGANSQSATYDALGRMVSATGSYGALSYTYDKLGNRLSGTQPVASAAPPLDGLGAITSFTYNQAGRLASSLAGAQTIAQYSYDAFGQRVSKTQPGSATVTRYQFDLAGRLLEESSSQGAAASAAYIYLDDGRPVATFTPSAGGALYFLHVDRLGAPQLATDASRATVWQADYQPFGQVGNTLAPLVQSLRFPGQQADAETGLYHNGFRDYVPGLGRYLQSDPVGLGGGLNTYAYAGANPMTHVDPLGTSFFDDVFHFVAAVVGVESRSDLFGRSEKIAVRTPPDYFYQSAIYVPPVPYVDPKVAAAEELARKLENERVDKFFASMGNASPGDHGPLIDGYLEQTLKLEPGSDEYSQDQYRGPNPRALAERSRWASPDFPDARALLGLSAADFRQACVRPSSTLPAPATGNLRVELGLGHGF